MLHDYFSSFNQSDHCFLASSLLKLLNDDDDEDDYNSDDDCNDDIDNDLPIKLEIIAF